MTQHTQPVVAAQHQQHQQQHQISTPQQQPQTTTTPNSNNNNNSNINSTTASTTSTPTTNNNQTQTLAVQQQPHQNNNNNNANSNNSYQSQQQNASVGQMFNSQLQAANVYVPTHGMPTHHHPQHHHHQSGAMYQTMIPAAIPSNVYVNNVTANVNLHGWTHTVPHGAWVHPSGAPHYIHGDLPPEQGTSVIQPMSAMPVALPTPNALTGPVMNPNAAAISGGTRGTRRGRGRGGSSGSRRGDFNIQRHPQPEGSPVPQQSGQTNQQEMQQQTDAQQMMQTVPPSYMHHPQYAAHAPQYQYGYPTFFAPQQHMIHPGQSAAAQQATGTPLYFSAMPLYNGPHMYNYGYYLPPVMNPSEYQYGEEVGVGDEHPVGESGTMMCHQHPIYSDEYGMSPVDMHAVAFDDMNHNASSMGSANETPSMLSPSYAPMYEQMTQQMGVMQIYDDPQMGQMQVIHSQAGVQQMEEDLSECGSQPSVPIQMVPPIQMLPTVALPDVNAEQIIHQPHLISVTGGALMSIDGSLPPNITPQHQIQHHGVNTIDENLQSYENVSNIQPGESFTSLNEEILQQPAENLETEYQQQPQQQQPQIPTQNIILEAVQSENYNSSKISTTDVEELQESSIKTYKVTIAAAATTCTDVAIETTTRIVNSNKQQQTAYEQQQQQSQEKHKQQYVAKQTISQQQQQQPQQMSQQQQQAVPTTQQPQQQTHYQTSTQHQHQHHQQQQQQHHQTQQQTYENRKSSHMYNQQHQSRSRKYEYHHGHSSSSSNNDNSSNQQQQQQQSQQTTKTMSWTNSSQHRKSTNTVAVTATPTTSHTSGSYNKQSNNTNSSNSHIHGSRTYTNQHNYHQNYHYQQQQHQPQTRNYGAMKMPSSPISSAPNTLERKTSQSSDKGQTQQQQQQSSQPQSTSTASTTAAPHQFQQQQSQQTSTTDNVPMQPSSASIHSTAGTSTTIPSKQQSQHYTSGFVTKKHSFSNQGLSGTNTVPNSAVAAATTSVINAVEAPSTPAINLAPPVSNTTPAPPSTPSWASLFASNSNNSTSAFSITAAPASNVSASSSSASTTPTTYAKKPVAKVAPYEGLTPVTPPPPIVTPGTLSYSAASAQNLPPPASTCSTSGSSSSSKKSSPNEQQSERNSLANLDEYSLKFAEFLTKYKSDWSTVSLRPRGLTNRSNYCYINSILQALLGCSPLYNLIRSIPKQAANFCEVKTPTVNAMITFMSNFSNLPSGLRLRNTKGTKGNKDDLCGDLQCDSAFEPTEIYKLWNDSREEHVEGRQEDAEEFLSYILNKLNDEMLEVIKLVSRPNTEQNGPNEPLEEEGDVWQMICNNRNKGSVTRQTDFGCTPLSDIFRGELRSRLQREGEHSTDVIQPFFTLQLNIEKAASVKEALEILVGRDQLEGVTGSKTKQEVVAWQQMNLEKLPPILILHLKWFDYRSDGCTKILKKVEFPVELKIDAKILASKKYSQKQRAYRLFAVVYHDGKEATKGHYITDVYHTGYGSWLRYDDSSVKPVSENHVLLPRTPRVPYLLCYRRCDTITQQINNNQNNTSTNNNNTTGNIQSSSGK